MEIHIDTKKDSDEEIKRAIRMLQAYVGQPVSGQGSESSSQGSGFGLQGSERGVLGSDSQLSDPSPGAFNIFGENNSSQDSESSSQVSEFGAQSSDNSLEINEKKEEKEEPKIQFIDY